MFNFEREENIRIERAGFDSRTGLKTYDYCSISYRYWCGECKEEIKEDGLCQCGWRTIEFRKAGI